jgi:hypothetical protein
MNRHFARVLPHEVSKRTGITEPKSRTPQRLLPSLFFYCGRVRRLARNRVRRLVQVKAYADEIAVR